MKAMKSNGKPSVVAKVCVFAVLLCTLFGVLGQKAHATFINGTIGFSGSGSVTTAGPTTTITFAIPQSVSSFDSGNYSGVPLGTSPVTFQSISFTGSGPTAILTPAPITPLWTVTVGSITYDFNLSSLANAFYFPGSSVIISGFGVAQETGFTDTLANYSLSGVYSSGNTFNFSISDQTSSLGIAVPDGSRTLALLAVGLAGIVGIRRTLPGLGAA